MPVIQVSGQAIYYQHLLASGRNAATLLFIHGLGSSHAFYNTVAPGLVQNGFSCLLLDTPGRFNALVSLAGADILQEAGFHVSTDRTRVRPSLPWPLQSCLQSSISIRTAFLQ
jgi:hypothetical protein